MITMTIVQRLAHILRAVVILTGALFVTTAFAQTPQTIGGTAPATPITYSPGHTFTLMLTGGGSGNPIVVTTSTSSVCSVSGMVVSVLTAGTCALTANQAGNGSYLAADPVSANVVINQAPQYIDYTFPSPFDYSPGITFTPTLTGGPSGNPVVLTTSTGSVCSVGSGGGGGGSHVVSVLTAGTCALKASQAGNINYEATEVNYNVIIYKLAQFIQLAGDPPVSPFPYAPGATFAVNLTGGASGNPIIITTTTPSKCSVGGTGGNIITTLAAGNCALKANQAGNASYNAAAVFDIAVTISKGSQTITFNALSDRALGSGDFTVSATASSGLAVVFNSQTTAKCTVSGDVVTLVATGTCTIRARQTGDANYLAAANVNQSFTVTSGSLTSQTITFNTLPDKVEGSAPFTVSATASSGLTVSFASTTTSVCTVSGSTVTLLIPGTCSITASQAGNGTYAAATPVSRSFSVTPAAKLHYIHPDHLGTPRVITKATDNAKVWEWKNDEPFGNNAPNEDPNSTGTNFKYNLRFPGQYADAETNTSYNYFRDYDPATGRYIESDPIGLKGGINTYAYVGGSPLRFVDPSGEQAQTLACFGGPVACGVAVCATVLAVGIGVKGTNDALQSRSNDGSPSPIVVPGNCNTPGGCSNCEQLKKDVQDAKKNIRSFSPAKCMQGMSRWMLRQRKEAWIAEAIARSKLNETCFNGGDPTHQEELAKAWSNAGNCGNLLQ